MPALNPTHETCNVEDNPKGSLYSLFYHIPGSGQSFTSLEHYKICSVCKKIVRIEQVDVN